MRNSGGWRFQNKDMVGAGQAGDDFILQNGLFSRLSRPNYSGGVGETTRREGGGE